ncbi:MAG: BlaI/MecI/CopY family transcriptional regulator [Actinomycetota bacterium]|nr:BlaI/MecI/CopY family transcriptional regulator [Actinomycetota bacterium]
MATHGEMEVPPPLHELESEVMELMWELGEANVRRVLGELNARAEKPRAYTTVMTIMARLDRKRLLSRRREGRTDVYVANLSREEYLAARAQAEVSAVVAQYGDEALVHFARQMDSLDPQRRERLRRLAKRDPG